jgi:hypothetical protein
MDGERQLDSDTNLHLERFEIIEFFAKLEGFRFETTKNVCTHRNDELALCFWRNGESVAESPLSTRKNVEPINISHRRYPRDTLVRDQPVLATPRDVALRAAFSPILRGRRCKDSTPAWAAVRTVQSDCRKMDSLGHLSLSLLRRTVGRQDKQALGVFPGLAHELQVERATWANLLFRSAVAFTAAGKTLTGIAAIATA